jgi:hypothetical protein
LPQLGACGKRQGGKEQESRRAGEHFAGDGFQSPPAADAVLGMGLPFTGHAEMATRCLRCEGGSAGSPKTRLPSRGSQRRSAGGRAKQASSCGGPSPAVGADPAVAAESQAATADARPTAATADAAPNAARRPSAARSAGRPAAIGPSTSLARHGRPAACLSCRSWAPAHRAATGAARRSSIPRTKQTKSNCSPRTAANSIPRLG